jgi:glutamyl-tRNA synthetase
MNKRFRFAPSPSGVMHLGNMRAALINYILAKQAQGTFVLRIEDTDKERSSKAFIEKINELLAIFKILPDEGPKEGGIYAPYLQSERNAIYEKYFLLLQEKKYLYRCFQTKEELEAQRREQEKNNLPPRYIRCDLSVQEEESLLKKSIPFVWRLAIQQKETLIREENDTLARYDLDHFSDFIIRRSDGSFTFLFTNFVDDITMKITDVIRGCDHKTNTILQSYLYDILKVSKPYFHHLPLITDTLGKKLSKRDNHFSIESLLSEGILPEAILNYLAIIGSSTIEEILSLKDIIEKNILSTRKENTSITYDYEKLLWINTQWMKKIAYHDFIDYLKTKYDFQKVLNNEKYVTDLKKESKTILDFITYDAALHSDQGAHFLKEEKELVEIISQKFITLFDKKKTPSVTDYLEALKEISLSKKEIFQAVRKIITGAKQGVGVPVLLEHISAETLQNKLNNITYT